MPVHHFGRSLSRGKMGEERIHKLFPTWTRTDGRKEDFITPEGKLVELKTEGRATTETKNLALELMSSPGKPGAIQRAVNDNIDYIIYLFADGKYFVYEPKRLLAYMNEFAGQYRLVNIPNRTYETTVMLVPRADVAHLELELK